MIGGTDAKNNCFYKSQRWLSVHLLLESDDVLMTFLSCVEVFLIMLSTHVFNAELILKCQITQASPEIDCRTAGSNSFSGAAGGG
ncbi:MAG: hypothetical protein ACK4GQ_04410 [Candidatus Hadarchaeales archaeon]